MNSNFELLTFTFSFLWQEKPTFSGHFKLARKNYGTFFRPKILSIKKKTRHTVEQRDPFKPMSNVEQENTGDVVWAKMNSFPYWPARVATKGEAIAENLKLTVGKSKSSQNSSSSSSVPNIEKDYTNEALEKARTYCNDRVNSRGEVFVNFFGSFDYAWVKREGTKKIISYEMNSEQR